MRDETLCEGKLEVATQQRVVTDTILLPALSLTEQTRHHWEHVWGIFPQNLFTHHYMVRIIIIIIIIITIIIIIPGVQSSKLTCEISPSFVPDPDIWSNSVCSVLLSLTFYWPYCSVKIRYYLLY